MLGRCASIALADTIETLMASSAAPPPPYWLGGAVTSAQQYEDMCGRRGGSGG